MSVKGQGVEPNADAALSWFKRAADNPTAAKDVREDAVYNRDFVERRLKQIEQAQAAARAQAAAANSQVTATFRSRVSPELENIGRATRRQEELGEIASARNAFDRCSVISRHAYEAAQRAGGTQQDADAAATAAHKR
ncbi:hypothetical protein [Bradyrhizobium stylosanthis]|uniref:hypothetical protein n=1 Tax=Bradyrhizobium stylosanthis TaxID=1803665 RepID=UPI0012E831BC|nr:hypothetical protein [Bradyrhizobium stylosanthis]